MRAQFARADNRVAGAALTRLIHKSSTSSNMSGKDTMAKLPVGELSPELPRVSQLGSPAKPTKLASIAIESPGEQLPNMETQPADSDVKPEPPSISAAQQLRGQIEVLSSPGPVGMPQLEA